VRSRRLIQESRKNPGFDHKCLDQMQLYFSQNQQEEENHVEKQIRDIIKTGEKKLEQHLMRKE